MNQLLDYIGSMVIGGIILIMMITFNGNVVESSGVQTFTVGVQSNLTTVTDIIESDFRKMGYRVSIPIDSAILYADTTTLKFRGDIDDNGVMDTVLYYLDTTGASLTPNPKDSVLYRKVNRNAPTAMYVGMISFKMRYYDSKDSLISGNVISLPSKIKSIKVAVSLQNKEPYDTNYVGVYWERKIKPKNLR